MAFNLEMQRALLADGDKLRDMLGEDHGPWFDLESPFLLIPEKQPPMVNYRAKLERPVYTPPTHYFWHDEDGPTDCTWIVPGTER